MRNLLTRFAKNEEGAALVEYGMLVGLIAVVCIAAVQLLGTTVNGVFGTLNTSSAHKTVDRIIGSFPSGQQAQIRAMLSDSIRGVVTAPM